MANYYGDSVTWYLYKYEDCLMPFFSRVFSDPRSSKYTTAEEFWQTDANKPEEISYYSVEISGENLVLTLQLPSDTDNPLPPTSIALFSTFQGPNENEENEHLVGKIMLSQEYTGAVSQQLNRGYDRIYVLPLPKVTRYGKSSLPKFYIESKKSVNPSGAELVSVEEHHHSVVYDSSGGVVNRDSYPNLTYPNFYESAQRKWIDTSKLPNQSYLYGEYGELQPTYSDMTGQLTVGGGFLGGKRDRKLTPSVADILVNVLEVIVMASNRIQIYGKEIPNQQSVTSEDFWILATNDRAESATRELRAISYADFRNGIVQKYSPGAQINSAIGVMETSTNINTFSFNPVLLSSLLIVINTNTNLNSAPLTIGTQTNVYAGDAVLVMWQNGSYTCRSLGGSAMKVYQQLSDGTLTLNTPNIKTLVVGDIYFDSTANTTAHMFRNTSGYVEVGNGTLGRFYAPEGFYAE